jgi:hypothetical protein
MPPPPISADTVRHAGPPLILPGAIFTGLFVAADESRYFVIHADAVRVVAFLQFGAAIPLGLFTATLVSRLRFLGIDAAGATIALFGGCPPRSSWPVRR